MSKCAVIGFVAIGLMAGPILAQDKMDCGRAYKRFWDKVERDKYAKISPEQLAGVSRMALRAYDACQAGDEQDAKQIFERVAALAISIGEAGSGPFNPNQPSR
jgi:hypothetical protein